MIKDMIEVSIGIILGMTTVIIIMPFILPLLGSK